MKKVLILHGYTTQYRVPFFKKLNEILKQNDVHLEVVIGQPNKHDKFDKIENCPFFKKVHNKYFYLGKRHLVWEPVLGYLKGHDLLIIRQAVKHLSNWPVLLYAKMNGIKIGYWGNMKEYIGNRDKKSIERLFLKKADHWFAYNDLTKKIVCSLGYPEKNVTSVQNSIDTEDEKQIYNSISETELTELRKTYGIRDRSTVGIFCSRLYADKRLEFLTKALAGIRKRVPDFHFFVIGDGVESQIVKDFAEENDNWFHWVGSQYGRDKVKYFKMAQFQLIPGLVGLHIVDSFAFETPIITTQNKLHSVEIAYLVNGVNGIMTPNSLAEYVDGVIEVATDLKLQKKLINGCREAAKHYTIENMAANFADGIIKTLGSNSSVG